MGRLTSSCWVELAEAGLIIRFTHTQAHTIVTKFGCQTQVKLKLIDHPIQGMWIDEKRESRALAVQGCTVYSIVNERNTWRVNYISMVQIRIGLRCKTLILFQDCTIYYPPGRNAESLCTSLIECWMRNKKAFWDDGHATSIDLIGIYLKWLVSEVNVQGRLKAH